MTSFCIYYLFENVTRNALIYQQWTLIQDIVGPTRLWPYSIRRLFWTENLKHFQRIIICAFVYVNGLNQEIFLEWVELMNLGRDRSVRNRYTALFRLFESENYSTALYAYNASNYRYEYLNGAVRRYIHRTLRH